MMSVTGSSIDIQDDLVRQNDSLCRADRFTCSTIITRQGIGDNGRALDHF